MRSIGVVVSSILVVSGVMLAAPAAAQQPQPAPAASSGGGVRIAVQGRIDAVNVLGLQDGLNLDPGGGGPNVVVPLVFVPLVTAGVRLIDTRLFLGVGVGFFGASVSQCGDTGCDEETTTSTSGFSLSPLVSFDLIQDPGRLGALYVVGWLNLANAGGYTVERVQPGRTDTTTVDGDFFWGLNAGIGLRGNITPGAAIGTEWGWGFATSTDDGDTSGAADDRTTFVHGIFGTIVFEATVGM